MTTAPVFQLAPLPAADVFTLGGPEGRHAATVRRLRAGERLDVTDGAGEVLRCEVAAARRDELDCQVLERVSVPAPAPRVVVVQALAKGDRGDLAVEMLTEVGVDEIVPWAASRSVVRWEGERGARSAARWAATATEAAKQARRARWPGVAPLASTAAVGDRLAAAGLALVLHEDATRPLAGLAGRHAPWPPAGDIVLVVGPEGGIAESELAAFEKAGAAVVRLGPTVLRTSTAGVAAAAVLLAATGRWDG
ncbi:16S rRNA (uracil(1498)-N(3))-methyltransferase [Frankia nepalensis]|uniref:Ribosomal RNA small subunit methyltransferase E n=1 Tax=Frankia nepalensis TaxID=1836974 RepID=A0A937RQL6_9ACTN|nr:16S rRNA (uracil(1498)-N(3))-methyltransferase [Frankia nepalensis]MBL7500140.1 16S rRNA (uracil(1498)-N(3))-methyltransferase [Frankia nepalensis]MBL7511172.1 16S rRNA (uracil(1498)-N(3))-methyltransferase [Frankia nepalensis]MBL7631584.1 16S rRNA (uracil(1498)-N(3))-methyltransferase [Frankia nepalensis]